MPAKENVMPTAAKPKRPRWIMNFEVIEQLIKQLEGSLHEHKEDERRFLVEMINLLMRVNLYDRNLETIIDSVRNLTSERGLRVAFGSK
jgi:hypothetical protein